MWEPSDASAHVAPGARRLQPKTTRGGVLCHGDLACTRRHRGTPRRLTAEHVAGAEKLIPPVPRSPSPLNCNTQNPHQSR